MPGAHEAVPGFSFFLPVRPLACGILNYMRLWRVSKTRARRRERLKFHATLRFPKGFLWGTATSAYQVEGGNAGSDWWAFTCRGQSPARCGEMADHYRRWRSDVGLQQRLHQTASRLSLEWSRLEPRPGEYDSAAVRHYRAELTALRAAGITPVVTPHHFSNPAWLAAQGGWARGQAVEPFRRYVAFCVERFGDLVPMWVTVNEPLVYATQAYVLGNWPPHWRSHLRALRVYLNLAEAHRVAYRVIHRGYRQHGWRRPQVGIACSAVSLYPYARHSFLAWLFILVADWLWNHSFFTLTRPRTHDFIGVNYYFHYRLWRPRFDPIRFFLEARTEHREMSSVGWEVYPQGIFDVLLDLRKYRRPIYVTENGIATTNESKRSRYLIAYLKEVYHAIQAGVDVRGYFYWSLVDNYEWEKGLHPRFGLAGVNYRSQRRTPRPAARL